MIFTQSRTPRLEFGAGKIQLLPRIVAEAEAVRAHAVSDLVLVSGGGSFQRHPAYAELVAAIRKRGWGFYEFACPGEPSPAFVDAAVHTVLDSCGRDAVREGRVVVAGVGGGSALDAGKAIAAMLPIAAASADAVPSVQDYLEGVGTRLPPGNSALYVACPTTAGTGSEATKNAVISRIGPGGFKKSLRHDGYIPAVALIDPELAVACPRPVSAAGGLDALTQLLEAWTSPSVSPFIAALCESGVAAVARGFARVLNDGGDLDARGDMAYAAYLSGIALANAGLGSVHALASPVGARFAVPHGVVCGRLIAAAAELNVRRLREVPGKVPDALKAYARAGHILGGGQGTDSEAGLDLLARSLGDLVAAAALPAWQSYGFEPGAIPDLARKAAAKTNPVALDAGDYESLLYAAVR